MNYLHQRVSLADGEVVEVGLNGPANVQLLDPDNFAAYQAGRPFRYYGGHITESTYRVTAPHPGEWHVVVDLGGGPGAVRAVVRVYPAELIAA